MELQRDILSRELQAKGITQSEFAGWAGISPKHLSRILSGKQGCSAIVAQHLAAKAEKQGIQISPLTLMVEAKRFPAKSDEPENIPASVG